MPAGRKGPKGKLVGPERVAVHPTPPQPSGQGSAKGKRAREGGATGGPCAANGGSQGLSPGLSPGLSRGFGEAARKKLRGEATQIALRRGSSIVPSRPTHPRPAPITPKPIPSQSIHPHLNSLGNGNIRENRSQRRNRKRQALALGSVEEEGKAGGRASVSEGTEERRETARKEKVKKRKNKKKGNKGVQGGAMVEDVAIHVTGAAPQHPTASPPGLASHDRDGNGGTVGGSAFPPPRVVVVTEASQLPQRFLDPPDCGASPDEPALVVGFDCEGISLSRYGRLCVLQVSRKRVRAP